MCLALVGRITGGARGGGARRLELERFGSALRGKSPLVVTGDEGRMALGVALRIVKEIERTLPSLVGYTPHHA